MASPCTARVQGKRSTPRGKDAWWVLNTILQHRGHERSDATWLQGSCSTAVGASAGTHAGGDAGDVTKYGWANRVKFGRLIGFNIHFRRALYKVWIAHIHWTLLFSSTVSRQAQAQNNHWYNRPFGNGLANMQKALDFLPDSNRIKFIRKDTSRWYVTSKGSTGYSQPGSSAKRRVVDRSAGWSFESIAVVADMRTGKQYVLTKSPTFYELATLTKTKPATAPATPAAQPQTEDALDPKSYGPGHEGKHITWYGQRLVLHDFGSRYLVGPGPVWGPTDAANTKDFQKSRGEAQTGLPTEAQLAFLATEPK